MSRKALEREQGLRARPRPRGLSGVVRRRASPVGVVEGQGSPRLIRRDAIYRRGLGLADLLSAGLALLLVLQLTEAHPPVVLVAALPMVVLLAKVRGLYDRDEYRLSKTTLDEAPSLFSLGSLYALTVSLVTGNLGRSAILVLWVAVVVLLITNRTAARLLARRLTTPERCLVLGSPAAASQLREKCAGPVATAAIVGRVPLDAEDHRVGRVPRLGDLEELRDIIALQEIDRVVIAPADSDHDGILEVIRLVKSLGVKVSVVPRLFEAMGSSVEWDDVDGLILLGVRRYGLSHSSRLLKRGMDLIGAVVALLLLAPVLLVIAFCVRVTSHGPVLFRQSRIGREGRCFSMLKFRTMVDGAEERQADLWPLNEAGGLFKIADDPRRTRVGRVLRQHSLDELPQLVNVLRGEMSLVGPRPLVPDEDSKVEGWQRQRLELPPGMTGVWQVLGSARIPLPEMTKLDYLYGANWSLWLDVKILLRTVPYVLAKRGM